MDNLLSRRRMMFGISGEMPPGYQRLEYLESTSTQYIIVPYRVNNKTQLYCRYLQVSVYTRETANAILGVTSSPSPVVANYGLLRLLNGNNPFNRVGWGDSTPGSVKDIQGYDLVGVWYDLLFDRNRIYIDGNLVATSVTDPNAVWQATYDLGLFARGGNTVTMRTNARIAALWAKEDNALVLNLIPCRRISDGVLGMYDTVSDIFLTNDGTGNFIAGPDV